MARNPAAAGPLGFFDLQAADPARVAEARRVFLLGLGSELEQLGSPSRAADALALELWERMSEPGRHYHTPVHVLSIFEQAGRLGLQLPAECRLAIWFHDGIYAPLAQPGRNEERSAAWIMECLPAAGIELTLALRAAESVRWTAHFLAAAVPPEHKLVLDLDLAGLGSAPESFERQSQAIRAEQVQRSEPEHQRVTLRVFETLLARERIYRTSELAPLEPAARANLERACEELRDRLRDTR
jgi:predicted metal-dependent HD superfamily phosphohydrolase